MSDTVWNEIEEGCHKSNVDLIASTDECKVMKIEDETGEGLMTMYEVFEGIYLMYNDFHMESCQSEFQHSDTLFAIDHCREGRIEMEGDGIYYCLEKGDLLIDSRVHHEGSIHFPLKHYHGITIAFQPIFAKKSLHAYMPSFDVNLEELADKFHLATDPYVIRTDASIDNIFAQLYRIPKRSRKDYFRIKIVELLIYLRDLDFEKNKTEKAYFYKTQVEKVHAIHDLITKDITKNYTQAQLSQMFSIGLTQMKQCFKSVYGQSIYTYLRTYRMNLAAELLITKELRVADIACECGYESAAKFGQAFKEQFGISPIEYRKSNGRKMMHER